jgi:hypothetical protein
LGSITVRHAKLPLNPDAVKAADDALYANHPELGGRKLTMSPEDGALRKEWMDSYLAAGGQADEPCPPTPPGSPAVPCPAKANPCAGQGLNDPKNIDEYAADMKQLKDDWPTLTKAERQERLQDALNKQLRKGGTPDIKVHPDPNKEPDHAAYDFSTGNLEVSDKDLSADEMPDGLTDTVYHESRHAEQWSNMARKMAGDAKAKAKDEKPPPTDQQISDQIHHDTGIDQSITDNAVKNPITPSSPQFGCAAAMADAVYGSGSEHREKTLTDLEDKGKVIDQIDADQTKMNDAQGVLDSPASTPEEQAKAKADYDQASADLKKTLDDNGFRTAEEAHQDYDKTYQDYRALPEEADAWDTGGKAKAAYDKL